ncbi:MAG: hypothetical protein ACO2OR_04960 [Desulfurococcaceae archaeon]
MKVISRIELLEPVLESSGSIRVKVLRVAKELWSPLEAGSAKITIDNLVEVAAENVVKHRSPEKLVLASVEAPGLKVILGENLLKGALTVLSPKPSYLKRILFVKCESSEKCSIVYEFRPSSQVLVYEGLIEVSQSINYDFIILECEDYKRIMLPHELMLPPVKSEVEKTKKARRRRRAKSKRGKSKKR